MQVHLQARVIRNSQTTAKSTASPSLSPSTSSLAQLNLPLLAQLNLPQIRRLLLLFPLLAQLPTQSPILTYIPAGGPCVVGETPCISGYSCVNGKCAIPTQSPFRKPTASRTKSPTTRSPTVASNANKDSSRPSASKPNSRKPISRKPTRSPTKTPTSQIG